MTAPKDYPMSRSQAARIAGLESARKNPEARRSAGERGGAATLEKYGRAHFVRMVEAKRVKRLKQAEEA